MRFWVVFPPDVNFELLPHNMVARERKTTYQWITPLSPFGAAGCALSLPPVPVPSITGFGRPTSQAFAIKQS